MNTTDPTFHLGAVAFMLSAWAVVLSILIWSFRRLMKGDPNKEQP